MGDDEVGRIAQDPVGSVEPGFDFRFADPHRSPASQQVRHDFRADMEILAHQGAVLQRHGLVCQRAFRASPDPVLVFCTNADFQQKCEHVPELTAVNNQSTTSFAE